MQVRFMKSFEVDKEVRNYDYSKYAVYADSGDYITNIFKHNRCYYTLFERTAYEDVETCLLFLKKYFGKSKRQK